MSANLIPILWESTLLTLYMVAMSTVLGTLIGAPLGIFLATSRRGELLSAPVLNTVLGLVVNAARSTPFIILVVAIIPLTRLIIAHRPETIAGAQRVVQIVPTPSGGQVIELARAVPTAAAVESA